MHFAFQTFHLYLHSTAFSLLSSTNTSVSARRVYAQGQTVKCGDAQQHNNCYIIFSSQKTHLTFHASARFYWTSYYRSRYLLRELHPGEWNLSTCLGLTRLQGLSSGVDARDGKCFPPWDKHSSAAVGEVLSPSPPTSHLAPRSLRTC